MPEQTFLPTPTGAPIDNKKTGFSLYSIMNKGYLKNALDLVQDLKGGGSNGGGGLAPAPADVKPPMSTTMKALIGAGSLAVVLLIGYGIYRAVKK